MLFDLFAFYFSCSQMVRCVIKAANYYLIRVVVGDLVVFTSSYALIL